MKKKSIKSKKNRDVGHPTPVDELVASARKISELSSRFRQICSER